MTGRPLAGMLLALLVVGPLLAEEPGAAARTQPPLRDPRTGLELRMWEWRRLRDQLDMLPLTSSYAAPEDAPKLPDVAGFDKLVVDALREVHNRGADLYNTARDFEAAFRMYQGGLVAVRPLLGHRPGAQKLIDEGIEAADKEPTPARRAFKLHETIEAVRKYLKDANEPAIKPIKPDPKVVEPVEPKPKPIKPIDPDPKTKPKDPADVKKPKDPAEVAPKPHDKKTEEKKPVEKKPDPVEVKKPKDPVEVKKPKGTEPVPAKSTGLTGRVTYKGKPVAAADLTLVSLDQKQPRVFTASINAEGAYSFAEALPPGRYTAIVTGKGIPEKYLTTTTSGIAIEVKAGANTYDIELK